MIQLIFLLKAVSEPDLNILRLSSTIQRQQAKNDLSEQCVKAVFRLHQLTQRLID